MTACCCQGGAGKQRDICAQAAVSPINRRHVSAIAAKGATETWLNRRTRVKEVPLSEAKDDLSRLLREAEKQHVVITRHGKPAGVLIGFESEDDWFEYKLEHDERFLKRIEQARKGIQAGRGVRLEDIK